MKYLDGGPCVVGRVNDLTLRKLPIGPVGGGGFSGLHEAPIEYDRHGTLDPKFLHIAFFPEDHIEVQYVHRANAQGAKDLRMVASQAEADAISAQLKKGTSFDKLVREKSIDPSKAQAGVVGWVVPSQLTPEIGAAVSKLSKGGTTAPIQTPSGWNIVKLDDKRPFKVPTLAEAQNQVRQQLLQRQRFELINKLRGDAKVTNN